jgi:hypothetical protein
VAPRLARGTVVGEEFASSAQRALFSARFAHLILPLLFAKEIKKKFGLKSRKKIPAAQIAAQYGLLRSPIATLE